MSKSTALCATHYKNNSSSQYSQAAKLLELIDVRSDTSILDVGCGHGHIIAELSQIAFKGKSIGVDASEEMIELAKRTFQNELYKNLEYFQTNAENLEFPPSSFDLILCTNVLMWVRDPQKALQLMISCLKPGGSILIFTYPTTTAYANLFEEVLLDVFPHLYHKSAVRTMLTPSQHKEILVKGNLKIDLFDLEDLTFFYENENAFKNYVKGWLVCYAPLNTEEQEIFLAELCKRVEIKGFVSPKGEISIPHQTLRITAKKVESFNEIS